MHKGGPHDLFFLSYDLWRIPTHIVAVIGGALLKRFKGIETKGLSALSLYVLSPALIFETLEKASITSNEVTVTVAFCLLNVIALWALSALAGKMLGLSQTEKSGLALTTILPTA